MATITMPAPQASAHSDRLPGGETYKHNFWDKENDLLFAGVAASRTLDYFSTLNMRRRGRQEILLTNDVVDNHAGFAAIEAASTGVSIGASYLFHRYGHHKLERWTSIVHIGLASGGAVRNYCSEDRALQRRTTASEPQSYAQTPRDIDRHPAIFLAF